MIDEQWAREHIGITPAVDETTEGVAMFALQIRRAMAEEHISVTLPQNWVIPVLADRDRIEAENAELRAQLEAQVARGGAVVVADPDREKLSGMSWSDKNCYLDGYRDAMNRAKVVDASQVLQPGMVGVDAGVLELLGIFFDQRISVEWEPEKVECDDLNRWAKEARKAVQEYRAQQSKGGDDVR